MKKCILIIGVRKQCYKAAIELGHDVVLWSDIPLKKKRKEGLFGWIEESYLDNSNNLNEKIIKELNKYKVHTVIANTEETVVLGARVREFLKLPRLAIDLSESFHNKWVMKNLAIKHEIPITEYELIDDKTQVEALIEHLGLPVVFKPVDESGAQDVQIAKTLLEVKKNIKPGLLAEAFVNGSEVSVETFIVDGKPVFHNITEYIHQWRKSAIPARVEENLKSQILAMNDKVISKFGVDRGMTHAEFYLTENGPVFGEIAIRPPGGYYMDLITKVYGFNSWQFYVNLSCGSNAKVPMKENGCAGVYIIHPGAGKIKSISGVEKIATKLNDIFDISIRKKVGDIIESHENTSNEIGHILFWAEDREQLDLDFLYIEKTLTFELEKLF